jgi:hypothetical protein
MYKPILRRLAKLHAPTLSGASALVVAEFERIDRAAIGQPMTTGKNRGGLVAALEERGDSPAQSEPETNGC